MRPLRNQALALSFLTSLAFLPGSPCLAERGYVLVVVQDAQSRPIAGLEIGIEGLGGSKTTGSDGKAQLAVASATKEGDPVCLAILHSPAGKDLVIISPWGCRAQVPSFEEKPENFIQVVVVQRGDRAALEYGKVLASFAEQINEKNAPKSVDEPAAPKDPSVNLALVAQQYGLSPEEVDRAIRSWGAKTSDPYEAGLAALYERHYSAASVQLRDSLHQVERKLTADQEAVAQDQGHVFDGSLFLGLSLFFQGRYREAADAYETCSQMEPENIFVLNVRGISLALAGDHEGAEPLYRKVLAIHKAKLGEDSPAVAMDLNNLAASLTRRRQFAAAESLLEEALAIDRRVLGPGDPNLGLTLAHQADIRFDKRDLEGAEPLYRQALAIEESALGDNNPATAVVQTDVAAVLSAKGDYSKAEPLLRNALAVDERVYGSDHPNVAAVLCNLAATLRDEHDYAGAEPAFRRALNIDEKALGPDHPEVAIILYGLARTLLNKGDYAGAKPLYQRELQINEKVLDPDDPLIATNLNDLGNVLYQQGDYASAEPLVRRALAIDVKNFGNDDPNTQMNRNNLDLTIKALAGTKDK
jgi:tetratricopeptide (TPR) repeat protein